MYLSVTLVLQDDMNKLTHTVSTQLSLFFVCVCGHKPICFALLTLDNAEVTMSYFFGGIGSTTATSRVAKLFQLLSCCRTVQLLVISLKLLSLEVL